MEIPTKQGAIESLSITSHGNDALQIKLVGGDNYVTRDGTDPAIIAALMTLLNLAASRNLKVTIGYGDFKKDHYDLDFVELLLPAK
jgi:hypothetical protein